MGGFWHGWYSDAYVPRAVMRAAVDDAGPGPQAVPAPPAVPDPLARQARDVGVIWSPSISEALEAF